MRRITVNLAPADLQKVGPAYDLPIAVAVLLSSGQIADLPDSALFLGELSLDGSLRHTNGILPMVMVAREEGYRSVYVPAADAHEAALVEGLDVMPVHNLAELLAHLRHEGVIVPVTPASRNGHADFLDDADGCREANSSNGVDLADIRGQEHAKRALEVAAAGGHNILMSGPPGSGKTLLARTLSSILHKLTHQEALEVTKIYSVSGLLPPSRPLIDQRPFRAPHYTISNAGLAIPTTRRDHSQPSRGAVPGRAAGVRTHGLGGAAPAVGGQGRDHQPRPGNGHLPSQLHAGGRHEPLPLRLRQRPRPRVQLHAQRHIQVPQADQRPPPG